MLQPITFYDIPSTKAGQKAWSRSTWKIRLCLNFKGIPYQTVWLEYPEIEALSRKLGLAPTSQRSDGSPKYTVPAIYDPNTTMAVADSVQIVRYLDKTYPDTPQLVPYATDALHAAFDQAFLTTVCPSLLKVVAVPTAECLKPRSAAWFRAAVDCTPTTGAKREESWAAFKNALQTLAQWLEADGTMERRFFLGDKIGYADITVAAFLLWIRVVLGSDSQEWKDIRIWNDGRWARFMDAFEKYESVDDGENLVL
ncbi:hypothetical protein ACG7TL_006273 [Trametes sanguinea]